MTNKQIEEIICEKCNNEIEFCECEKPKLKTVDLI